MKIQVWPNFAVRMTLLATMLLASCSSHRTAATPPAALPAETEHYCNDAGFWAKWHEFYERHPADDDIAALYALRIGLCKMLVDGVIESDRAIKLFNQAHDTVARKTEKEERRRKGREM